MLLLLLSIIWDIPHKEYGLRVSCSIGEFCEKSKAIIIGRVDSLRSKFTAYNPKDSVWKIIETYVYMKILDKLKFSLPDSFITLRIEGGQIGRKIYGVVGAPRFSSGETVLVFLRDYVFPPHFKNEVIVIDSSYSYNTYFDVMNWELGKFRITRDSVRFRNYGVNERYGLSVNLCKEIIRSAMLYPKIVDAKIDTLYEETKRMVESKTPYSSIKTYVENKLLEIANIQYEH